MAGCDRLVCWAVSHALVHSLKRTPGSCRVRMRSSHAHTHTHGNRHTFCTFAQKNTVSECLKGKWLPASFCSLTWNLGHVLMSGNFWSLFLWTLPGFAENKWNGNSRRAYFNSLHFFLFCFMIDICFIHNLSAALCIFPKLNFIFLF